MAAQEWAPIIQALTAGESLDYGQSYWLMDQVMSGELGEARLASFLTARPQDEWLATWAGAAAVVADPIDPIILQETVADVLCGAK